MPTNRITHNIKEKEQDRAEPRDLRKDREKQCIWQTHEAEIYQFPTRLQGGLTTSVLFVDSQGSPRVRWIQFSNLPFRTNTIQYSQSHSPSSPQIETFNVSDSGKDHDRNKRERE
jgi:hypothetical protein